MITVYIDPEQKQDLDRLADLTRVKAAVYIREGIDDVLAKYRRRLQRPKRLRLTRRP